MPSKAGKQSISTLDQPWFAFLQNLSAVDVLVIFPQLDRERALVRKFFFACLICAAVERKTLPPVREKSGCVSKRVAMAGRTLTCHTHNASSFLNTQNLAKHHMSLSQAQSHHVEVLGTQQTLSLRLSNDRSTSNQTDSRYRAGTGSTKRRRTPRRTPRGLATQRQSPEKLTTSRWLSFR